MASNLQERERKGLAIHLNGRRHADASAFQLSEELDDDYDDHAFRGEDRERATVQVVGIFGDHHDHRIAHSVSQRE